MKSLLLFALMWKDELYLKQVETHIKNFYKDFIVESPIFELPYSKYYYEEMGKPLFKKFVAMNYLTKHINLPNIKRHCMFIEDKFSINNKRTVNIDPILLDTEKVIVATKKYRGNRIQIDKNLFVELELWFYNNSFQPFLWTYLDYKENIPFFNNVKKILKRYK